MIVSFPARKEGMILCLDNVLDENLCHELVGKLQPMYEEVAQDGKTVGGVMYNVKRSSDLTLSESTFTSHSSPWDSRFAAIEMAIFDAFHTAVASYRDIYRHTQDWTSVADTGYQIQKYHRNDGYYREHVDSFPSENPEMAARVLAGIVYLNDVKHGGQTNFPLHGACIERMKPAPRCRTINGSSPRSLSINSRPLKSTTTRTHTRTNHGSPVRRRKLFL
jgi:hypothetical protein